MAKLTFSKQSNFNSSLKSKSKTQTIKELYNQAEKGGQNDATLFKLLNATLDPSLRGEIFHVQDVISDDEVPLPSPFKTSIKLRRDY